MKFEVVENLVLPKRQYLASASYGAAKFLPQTGLTRHFEWMHGWRPTWFDDFPEEGIGGIKKNSIYGVADPIHRALINNLGSKAWVIGLPFAYELLMFGESLKRVPNSCIYLPPHVTHEYACDIDSHISSIAGELNRYSNVTICLHWATYRSVKVRESYEKYGWTVVEGANNNDINSLNRLVCLFKQHEALIVDYYGSHIAYASACGVNLHFVAENLSRLSLDFKGLTTRNAKKWRELTCLDTIKRNLNNYEDSAGSTLLWGLNEIGYQYVDLTKLNRVRYSCGSSIANRIAKSVLRRATGVFGVQRSADFRDQLATFISEKTLFNQPMLIFDSATSGRLFETLPKGLFVHRSAVQPCGCSNGLSEDQYNCEGYGTVVVQYCVHCYQAVSNHLRRSTCHAKFILYTFVTSADSVRDSIPCNLSTTFFDMRLFNVCPDPSKPEVLYCLAYVVDRTVL